MVLPFWVRHGVTLPASIGWAYLTFGYLKIKAARDSVTCDVADLLSRNKTAASST
jgi:hypothetical protein